MFIIDAKNPFNTPFICKIIVYVLFKVELSIYSALI